MSDLHRHALQLISLNDWDGAHHLIQNYDDEMACLIHAYLHRQEGDIDNALYWYHKAGYTLPNDTIEKEFDNLLFLIQRMDT
jgi:hypothetical protein